MFWKSVFGGLASLLDWHIIVGLFGFGVAFVLATFLAKVGKRADSRGIFAETTSSLERALVALVQALSFSAFILICLPAILGIGGFLPATAFSAMAWLFIKNSLMAFLILAPLVAISLHRESVRFIPYATFFYGILVFLPFAKRLHRLISNGAKLPDESIPSLWHCAGFAVVGTAAGSMAVFIPMAFTAGTIAFLFRKDGGNSEAPYTTRISTEPLIKPVVGFVLLILGIIPLLMYGKFIGLSMSSSFADH